MKKISLEDAINNRESTREFSKKSLTKDELTYLLEMSSKRPSAGALLGVDVYVSVNNVKDMPCGKYLYRPGYGLTLIRPDNIINGIYQNFPNVAAYFIWISRVDNMFWKYHQRSHRYIQLEAGHLCQNLYLLCQQIRCGCCAIGAFNDSMVSESLFSENTDDYPLYIAAVGKI